MKRKKRDGSHSDLNETGIFVFLTMVIFFVAVGFPTLINTSPTLGYEGIEWTPVTTYYQQAYAYQEQMEKLAYSNYNPIVISALLVMPTTLDNPPPDPAQYFELKYSQPIAIEQGFAETDRPETVLVKEEYLLFQMGSWLPMAWQTDYYYVEKSVFKNLDDDFIPNSLIPSAYGSSSINIPVVGETRIGNNLNSVSATCSVVNATSGGQVLGAGAGIFEIRSTVSGACGFTVFTINPEIPPDMIDTVVLGASTIQHRFKVGSGNTNYDCGIAFLGGVPSFHTDLDTITGNPYMNADDLWFNATVKTAWTSNFNSALCRDASFGFLGQDHGLPATQVRVLNFIERIQTNLHPDGSNVCDPSDDTNCVYSYAWMSNTIPSRAGSNKDASTTGEYFRIVVDPKIDATDGHWQMKEHSFYPTGTMDDCGFSRSGDLFRIDSGSTDAEQGQCIIFKTFHNGDIKYDEDFVADTWTTTDVPRFSIDTVKESLEIRVDDQNQDVSSPTAQNGDGIYFQIPTELKDSSSKFVIQIPYNGTFTNGTASHRAYFAIADVLLTSTCESGSCGTFGGRQRMIGMSWELLANDERTIRTHYQNFETNTGFDAHNLVLNSTDLGSAIDDGCIEISRNFGLVKWSFYDDMSCTGTPLQSLQRSVVVSGDLDFTKFSYSDLFSAGTGGIDIDIHNVTIWDGVTIAPVANFKPDIAINVNASGTGSSEMRVFVDVFDGAMDMGNNYGSGATADVISGDMQENLLRADIGAGENHRLGIIEVDLPFEGEILLKPNYDSGDTTLFTVFVGLQDNSTDGTIILDINNVTVGTNFNNFTEPIIRFHEETNFPSPSAIKTILDTGYVSVNATLATTDALDLTGLEAYWNFEQTTGSLENADFSNIDSGADSTIEANMSKIETGVIGNAWKFSATENKTYIKIGGVTTDWDFLTASSVDGLSFNFWTLGQTETQTFNPPNNGFDGSVLFTTLDEHRVGSECTTANCANGTLIWYNGTNSQSTVDTMVYTVNFFGGIPPPPIFFDNSLSNTAGLPDTSNDQVWHMYTITLDATTPTNSLKWYKDGVSIQNVTVDASDITALNTDLPNDVTPIIGNARLDIIRSEEFLQPMSNQTLDEFSIWSRIITPSEITTLYNSGNGKELQVTSAPVAPALPIPNPITGGNVTQTSSLLVDWVHDGINTTGYRIYRTSTESNDTETILDNTGKTISTVALLNDDDFNIASVEIDIFGEGSVFRNAIVSDFDVLMRNDTASPVTSGGLIGGAIWDLAFAGHGGNVTIARSSNDIPTQALNGSYVPFNFNFRDTDLVNLTSSVWVSPFDGGVGIYKKTPFTGNVTLPVCTTDVPDCTTPLHPSGKIMGFDTAGAGFWTSAITPPSASADMLIKINIINQTKLSSPATAFVNDTGSLETSYLDNSTVGKNTYFYRIVPLNGDIEGTTIVILNGTQGLNLNQTITDVVLAIDAGVIPLFEVQQSACDSSIGSSFRVACHTFDTVDISNDTSTNLGTLGTLADAEYFSDNVLSPFVINATGKIEQAVIQNGTNDDGDPHPVGQTQGEIRFGSIGSDFNFLHNGTDGNNVTSINFWINGDVDGSPEYTMLSNLHANGGGTDGIQIFARDADTQMAIRENSSVNLNTIIVSSIPADDGQWHMVTVVYDKGNTTGSAIIGCIDAVCQNTASWAIDFVGDGNNPTEELALGAVHFQSSHVETTTNYDDLAIWNGYQLTQSDIDTLFNVGLVGQTFNQTITDTVTVTDLVNATLIEGADPVTGLTAIFNETTQSIDLSWDASAGADSYRIYRTSTEIADDVVLFTHNTGVSGSFDMNESPKDFVAETRHGSQFRDEVLSSVIYFGVRDIESGSIPAEGGEVRGAIFLDANNGVSTGDDTILANSTNFEIPENLSVSFVQKTFLFRDTDMINLTTTVLPSTFNAGYGMSWFGRTNGSVNVEKSDHAFPPLGQTWTATPTWDFVSGQDFKTEFRAINKTKLSADPEVSDTGSNATTFSDTNIDESRSFLQIVGETYFYRLVGLNSLQEEGGFSSVVNATAVNATIPLIANITITDTVEVSDSSKNTTIANLVSNTYENADGLDVLSIAGSGTFEGFAGNIYDNEEDPIYTNPVKITGIYANMGSNVDSGFMSMIIATNASAGSIPSDMVIVAVSDESVDLSNFPQVPSLPNAQNDETNKPVLWNFTSQPTITFTNDTFIGFNFTDVIASPASNAIDIEAWTNGGGFGNGQCYIANTTASETFAGCIGIPILGYEINVLVENVEDWETTSGIEVGKLVVHHSFDDAQLYDSGESKALYRNAGTLQERADASALIETGTQGKDDSSITGLLGEAFFMSEPTIGNDEGYMTIGFSDYDRIQDFNFINDNVTDTFSINVWVRGNWTTQSADFIPIISNLAGDGDFGFYLGMSSLGEASLGILSLEAVIDNQTTTATVSDDDWSMLTLIVEKSNVTSTVQLCLDAVCEGIDRDNPYNEYGIISNKLIVADSTPNNFANVPVTNSPAIPILIDELCIWEDYKLTSSDLSTLHNSGSGAVCGVIEEIAGTGGGLNVTLISAPQVFNVTITDTVTSSDQTETDITDARTWDDPYLYYSFDTDTIKSSTLFDNLGTAGDIADGIMAIGTISGNPPTFVNATIGVAEGTLSASGLFGQAVIVNGTDGTSPVGETWVQAGTQANREQWAFLNQNNDGTGLRVASNQTSINFWYFGDITNGGDTHTWILGTACGNDAGSGTSIWYLIGQTHIRINFMNDEGIPLDVIKYGNQITGQTLPSSAQWHMVTITLTKTDTLQNELDLYINGVHETAGTYTQSDVWTSVVASDDYPNPLILGGASNHGDDVSCEPINGDAIFDELAVWNNYILNQTEVTTLYNGGSGLTVLEQPQILDTTGLEGYYKFEETSGNVRNEPITNLFPQGNSTVATVTSKVNTGLIGNAWRFGTGDPLFEKIILTGSNATAEWSFISSNVTTMNFWIKGANPQGNGMLIDSKPTSQLQGIHTHMTTQNRLQYIQGTPSITFRENEESANDFFVRSDPSFTMYTFVRNGGTINYYKNGTLFDTDTTSFNESHPTVVFPRFGNLNNVADDRPLEQATIDEWSFWSRALNATDVSSLYNNGFGLELDNQTAIIPNVIITDTATVSDQVTVTKQLVDTGDLFGYWKFDNAVINNMISTNPPATIPDGDVSNSVADFTIETGIIGTAYKRGSATDGQINLGTTGNRSQYDFLAGHTGNDTSYNFWAILPDANREQWILSTYLDQAGDPAGIRLIQDSSDIGGNFMQFEIRQTTGSFLFASQSANIVPEDDLFHMYTVVVDHDDGTVDWYRDGEFVEQDTGGTQCSQGQIDLGFCRVDATLQVGDIPDNTPEHSCLNCTFDELSIWNRNLTQADITNLYNFGQGLELENQVVGLPTDGSNTKLELYYKFNATAPMINEPFARISTYIINNGTTTSQSGVGLGTGLFGEANGAHTYGEPDGRETSTLVQKEQFAFLNVTGVDSGLTLNVWARGTGDCSAGDTCTFLDTSTGGFNNGIFFGVSNALSAGMRVSIDGNFQNIFGGLLSTDDTWHMYTFRMNNTGEMEAYKDAVFENSATFSAGIRNFLPIVNTITIGGETGNPSQNFEQFMDEMSLWSTALSQEQLDVLYNNGTGFNITGTAPNSFLIEESDTVTVTETAPVLIEGDVSLPVIGDNNRLEWYFKGEQVAPIVNENITKVGFRESESENSVTLGTGIIGSGLDFSGTGDNSFFNTTIANYQRFIDALNNTVGEGNTYNYWLKSPDRNRAQYFINTNLHETVSVTEGCWNRGASNQDDWFLLDCDATALGDAGDLVNFGILFDDTYHMYTVAVDPINQFTQFYRDGLLVGNFTGTTWNNSTISHGDLTIGAHQQASQNLSAGGQLDEISIWSTELDLDQVKFLYRGGNGTEIIVPSVNTTDLEAYWKFEETSGNMTSESFANIQSAGSKNDTDITKTVTGKFGNAWRSGLTDGTRVEIGGVNTEWDFLQQDDVTWNWWMTHADPNHPSDLGYLITTQTTQTGHRITLDYDSLTEMTYLLQDGLFTRFFAELSGELDISCRPDCTTFDMYTVTKNNTSGDVKWYRNGTLIETDGGGDTSSTNTPQIPPVLFGRGNAEFFTLNNATLDEFSIWSRVLTPTEVTTLFNNGDGLELTGTAPAQPIQNQTEIDTVIVVDNEDFIIDKTIRNVEIFSGGTNTTVFADNFTNYVTQGEADGNWTTTDTARLRVNISNDELDFSLPTSVTTNDVIAHDLNATLQADDKFALRFKLDIQTYATNTDATALEMHIGLSDSDETVIQSVSQDWIGMGIQTVATLNDYQVVASDNSPPSGGGSTIATFTRSSSQELIFVEIIRNSTTNVIINQYSDSSYNILLESQSGTISSGITDLQYLKVMVKNADGTANGDIIGIVDDIYLIEYDFFDNFSGVSPDWDNDSGNNHISVNTGTNQVEFDVPSGVAEDDALSHNLISTIDDNNWKLRFKLNTTALVAGSNGFGQDLFIGLGDSNATSTVIGQDFLGLVIDVDLDPQMILSDVDNDDLGLGGTPFTTLPSIGTQYIELERDVNTFFGRIYSDALFSVLIETKSLTTVSTIDNLQFIKLNTESTSASTDHTYEGIIDDVTFIDGAGNPIVVFFTGDLVNVNELLNVTKINATNIFNQTETDTAVVVDNQGFIIDKVIRNVEIFAGGSGSNFTIFADNFTSYANQGEADAEWARTSTDIIVNVATDEIDASFFKVSTNRAMAHDLGQIISDESWLLKFKWDIQTADDGGNTGTKFAGFALGNKDQTAGTSDANQQAISMVWNLATDTDVITCRGSNSTQMISGTGNLFDHGTQVETLFVTLERVAPDRIRCSLYSDENYNILIEQEDITSPDFETISDLRYIKFFGHEVGGTVAGEISGVIDDIYFTDYNYFDNLQTDDFTTMSGTRVSVNTASQFIDWDSSGTGLYNQGIVIDPVLQIIDTGNWTLRAKMNVTALSAGSDTTGNDFFLVMSADNTNEPNIAQDSIGFRFSHNNPDGIIRVLSSDGTVINSGATQGEVFTTNVLDLGIGDVYLEVVRGIPNSTAVTATIYSDPLYLTPIESVEEVIESGTTGIRYLKVMVSNRDGTGDSTYEGTLDDITFLNGGNGTASLIFFTGDLVNVNELLNVTKINATGVNFNQTVSDIVTIVDEVNDIATVTKIFTDIVTTADAEITSKNPVPNAINDLSAFAVGNSCELTWSTPINLGDPLAPINGYGIFSSVDGGLFIPIVANTSNTNTAFNHTGLNALSTYLYNVTAFNKYGTSLNSNIDSCVPQSGSDPPSIPTGLTAVNQGENVFLDWDHDTVGNPTGFKIERALGDGAFFDLVSDTSPDSSTNFLDNTVVPATSYRYRISAINAFGTSDPSGVASITTLFPPTQPTLMAVQNGSKISLTWTEPQSDEPINGYTIERRINFGSLSIFVANTTTTSLIFDDFNVTKPNTYGYLVKALSSLGVGLDSNIVDVVFGSHTTVEVREQDGSGFKGGGTVRLENSTFTLDQALDSGSNAIFDNLESGNYNFTFIDADNFILNKTFAFPHPSGNLSNSFTIFALVFDVDCPSAGTGTDVRIKVNYTDGKDITEYPATPVCDSSDKVSWSVRWQGDAGVDMSTMIADFISNNFKTNADQFLVSAIQTDTIYNSQLNQIESVDYVVNNNVTVTDVTINFDLFLGEAPPSGGSGGSGATPPAGSTIPQLKIELLQRLTGLSVLSRTHTFASAGDVIEGAITVEWEGEAPLTVKSIDVGEFSNIIRFEIPPTLLAQMIEGSGEFAMSSADIPYIITLPPFICDEALGITQNCVNEELLSIPISFIFESEGVDYTASTTVMVDLRPIPFDLPQLQIILLGLVLIISAIAGNFIRQRIRGSDAKRASRSRKKKFKKKFDSS